MSPATKITPLPPHTRSILRSTVILTSLVQLVSELIQNSLDANARTLDIGVDCEEWSCWVRDDGDGITRDDLDVIANTHQHGTSSRYSTSKSQGLNDTDQTSFGFRGEALASVADLSILEISSRTARSRQSWSMILKGSQNLYTGPSIRWKHESHGTTVCVRDAFHNLPIRRRSHPSPTRTLELIRRVIETYALVFPDISFTLKHSQTHKRLMVVPKTSSTLDTFRHLFGRALIQHVQEIDIAQGELKLNGFISLNGAPSKIYQFLYINRHPLSPCDLHRIIEKKFTSSTFVKHAYDETGETRGPRPTTRRSPRTGEKKPVYVLNLTIPPRNIDNCIDPAKMVVQVQNNTAVSTFLSSIIEDFLTTHRFISQKGVSQSQSNLQIVTENIPPPKRKKVTHDQQTRPSSPERLAPIDDGYLRPSDDGLYICNGTAVPEEFMRTDPTTGALFVVDNKTGNSCPSTLRRDGQFGKDTSGHPAASTRRSIPLMEHTIETGLVPEWIQAALQENEVYAVVEPKIPAIPLSSVFTSDIQHYESQRTLIKSKHGYCYSTYGSHDPSSRFAREDLAQATILGQVDRKFIACLINSYSDEGNFPEASSSSSKSLSLIDQHAADERIRVEGFLQELCSGFQCWDIGGGVKVATLDPAVPILLTRHEYLMLTRSGDVQDAFARWGVEFDKLDTVAEDMLDERDESDGYVQVLVRAVPDIVSRKLLRSEDLRELVKGYLADLNTDRLDNLQTQPNGSTDEFSWQKAVRKCPSQLLDLVNSKACRGAMMFNDPLSMEQCQKLVQQLSKTAFPFRCAHGRPSLVPLLNLGPLSSRRRTARPIDWEEFERFVTHM